MDMALRALADGTRRQILALVWDEERTAGAIASEFALTRPAISHHLAVLAESGLVSVRRQGTRRFYRTDRRMLTLIQTEMKAFWNDRLRRLKYTVEAGEGKKRER
jgi:DNA-binding transcriptional ArsR family regulator